MNHQAHTTIHSLVPVYASLSRIIKMAVDGHRDGNANRYIDIRTEAEAGMSDLVMLEAELVGGKGVRGRRSYEQANVR